MLFHSQTVISSSSVDVVFMLVFEMSGDYSARTFAFVITNDFCTNLLQQLIYTYTVGPPYTLKFGALETPVKTKPELFSLYFCHYCVPNAVVFRYCFEKSFVHKSVKNTPPHLKCLVTLPQKSSNRPTTIASNTSYLTR